MSNSTPKYNIEIEEQVPTITEIPAVKFDDKLKDEILSQIHEEKAVIIHCTYSAEIDGGIRNWNSTFLIDKTSGDRSTMHHAENISIAPEWTYVPGCYRDRKLILSILNHITMNRFILLAFGLFSLVNGYSQVQYATYYNPMDAVTYNIQLETAKDDDYSIYVYGMHITMDFQTGGFYIQKKNLDGFLSDFLVAKQKYEAWTKTAKENKIEALAKKIEIPKSQKTGGFFKTGDSTTLNTMSINRHLKPVYSFLVTKDKGLIKYYLAIFTDAFRDPQVPLLISSGYGLIFSSPEEAMSFYSLLQPEKIKAFLSKQPKLDELFR